jgi:hypothetical protein
MLDGIGVQAHRRSRDQIEPSVPLRQRCCWGWLRRNMTKRIIRLQVAKRRVASS